MNKLTCGILFYEYYKKRFYLYLRKNSKDYHEDFLIKDEITINLLKKNILYKIYNNEQNHIVFLINRNNNKYSDLFDKIELYEKITYSKFISKPFHKTLKHKRLKIDELDSSLNLIRINYILRSKFIFNP